MGSSAPSTARSASGWTRASRKVPGRSAGPVELRAEQRDPADHEQGDGHHVAVGEPGQDPGARPRRPRTRPGRLPGSAVVSTAMPAAAAASASNGGRSVNDSPGAGFRAPPISWVMISPAQYKRGRAREPSVAPRDRAVVPARAEPQAHRRGAPRQHAKHAHTRFSEMIRRTRAPSVPPRRS